MLNHLEVESQRRELKLINKQEAELLLNSGVIDKVGNKLTDKYCGAWISSIPSDAEKRENLYYLNAATQNIIKEIKTTLTLITKEDKISNNER